MTLFQLKALIDKACEAAKKNHGEAAEECRFYLHFVMEEHDRIVVRPPNGENYLVMGDTSCMDEAVRTRERDRFKAALQEIEAGHHLPRCPGVNGCVCHETMAMQALRETNDLR